MPIPQVTTRRYFLEIWQILLDPPCSFREGKGGGGQYSWKASLEAVYLISFHSSRSFGKEVPSLERLPSYHSRVMEIDPSHSLDIDCL